jgi:hypothetical protein
VDDLRYAIGVPFDVSSNTIDDAGAVALFAGAVFGITPEGTDRCWRLCDRSARSLD